MISLSVNMYSGFSTLNELTCSPLAHSKKRASVKLVEARVAEFFVWHVVKKNLAWHSFSVVRRGSGRKNGSAHSKIQLLVMHERP